MREKLHIYYDGLCPLCSREIEHYQKRVTDDSVRFIDIAEPDFNASAHGLDPEQIHQTMHVKLDDRIYTGMDAFLVIWRTIPGYLWLNKIVTLPGIVCLARLAYEIFARIRPILPKRKRCSAISCAE